MLERNAAEACRGAEKLGGGQCCGWSPQFCRRKNLGGWREGKGPPEREELGGRGTAAPGELQGLRDWSIGVCKEQLQEWMGGLGGEGSGRSNLGSDEDHLGPSVEGGWGRDLKERVGFRTCRV